ncbi:M48 family metallopeptidase [Acidobacteria bacterium AH-259-G07]|nr:M48 family metallopeptidase [Acidobacteria bacterium AH-259-G07]
MKRRQQGISIGFLLAILFLFPFHAYAGRKHADVENIGNRSINGKIAWFFPNFVSLEKEIQIGAQYSQFFEQTARLVEDPVVVEYVDRVAQHIVKHSDAKVPFVVKVVDTDEVNAFALPGGYFFINKGLILESESESEMAGVMAHEIAHVTARHATERMTKAQLLQFATIPALFVGGYWTQYGIYQGLGMGMSLAVLGITRKSEAEADQLGTQYLWNSDYDPHAFISFFEKLHAKEKEKPGKFASFWRTHPSIDNRIVAVQEEISYLPPRDEYVLNSSEFERVKGRLVELDNNLITPGSTRQGAAKRPTLKRKTNRSSKDKEKPTLKRDRPTLKRDGPTLEGSKEPNPD